MTCISSDVPSNSLMKFPCSQRRSLGDKCTRSPEAAGAEIPVKQTRTSLEIIPLLMINDCIVTLYHFHT